MRGNNSFVSIRCHKSTATKGVSGATPFQRHVRHDGAITPRQHKATPKCLTWLKRNMHLWVHKLVVNLEESRRHKPSGCIDFGVIDLMVPCDNWQLSLITRQGPKISLRKWPALWDVVQRLNKDKSIHLRKQLRTQNKRRRPHADQPAFVQRLYILRIISLLWSKKGTIISKQLKFS